MRYLPRTCKTARPITCVSFRDTMDPAQKFEGVTWDKNVSLDYLERIRKYPILSLRGSQPESVPLWCYQGLTGRPCLILTVKKIQ